MSIIKTMDGVNAWSYDLCWFKTSRIETFCRKVHYVIEIGWKTNVYYKPLSVHNKETKIDSTSIKILAVFSYITAFYKDKNFFIIFLKVCIVMKLLNISIFTNKLFNIKILFNSNYIKTNRIMYEYIKYYFYINKPHIVI